MTKKTQNRNTEKKPYQPIRQTLDLPLPIYPELPREKKTEKKSRVLIFDMFTYEEKDLE